MIWEEKTPETSGVFSLYLYRGVEQLVARWAHNPKVVGSSPAPATNTPPRLALVAAHLGGFFF